MQEQSSLSAGKKKPRLLSPAALLVLGLALVCLLLMLLPSRGDLEDRITAQGPDQLSLTYLELAIHEAPENTEIRLLLARHYHKMSRYADAAAMLAPLLGSRTPAGQKARRLLVEVEHARCTTGKFFPKVRCPETVIDAIERLRRYDQPLGASLLEELVAISIANHQPGLAGNLYEQLAHGTQDAEKRKSFRQAAAFAYLQAELPERAAAMHMQLVDEEQATTSTVNVERAVVHLRQANQSPHALELVQKELDKAPRNQRLLRLAIKLALENSRPRLAAELGRRLVDLAGQDAELVRQQIALELAIGDTGRALELGKKLVAARPEDPAAREELARIADWVAKPLIALEQWRWLALRSDEERFEERATALARAAWDLDTLLTLTLRKLHQHPGDMSLELELARIYMQLGRPDKARVVLERVVARHPEHRPAWNALLDVHRVTADFAAEAAVWARIHERSGTTEAEACAWARALWQAGRPEEAMAVLEARLVLAAAGQPAVQPASASKEAMLEVETLRIMGELAWQLDRLDRAREVYERLWRRGQAKPHEEERLMVAARATGALDLALRVARESWQRHGRPSSLLLAMQMAADARRWRDLGELEAMAETSSGALDPVAAYWRLRIARRGESLRVALGRKDFDDALTILSDMGQELEQGGTRSRELRVDPDYKELWINLYRQKLHVALQRQDYGAVEELLDTTPALKDTFDYWRIRLLLRHRGLEEAVRQHDLDRAKATLDEMATELAQARASGFGDHPEYARLQADMNRQSFYIALARGDHETAARMLEVADIPGRDRVQALVHLGRHERAASLALTLGKDSGQDQPDPDIDAQIEAITRRLPRHLSTHARIAYLGGAAIQEAGQEVEYTWQELGVGAEVTGTRLAQADQSTTHEAELRLSGRWLGEDRVTEAGAGIHARDQSVVPRLDIGHTQRVGQRLELGAQGGVGLTTEESARLRQSAVRDHAALQAQVDLGEGLFTTGRLGSYRYRRRTGGEVGTGMDTYLGLGYRLHTGAPDWNVRLVGGAMSRSCGLALCCADPQASCSLMQSQSSQVLALATTLTNGLPGLTPAPVDRLHYLVELSAGWLMPAEEWVYSASLGIGFSVFGADELSLSAELSSALDMDAPWSQSRRGGIMVEYARSLWR